MNYIPPVEFERALQLIREEVANLGSKGNPSQVAFAVFRVCLGRGLNTKDRICKVAKGLGLDTRQVATILDQSTGKDPDLFPWYLEDGRYFRHPD